MVKHAKPIELMNDRYINIKHFDGMAIAELQLENGGTKRLCFHEPNEQDPSFWQGSSISDSINSSRLSDAERLSLEIMANDAYAEYNWGEMLKYGFAQSFKIPYNH